MLLDFSSLKLDCLFCLLTEQFSCAIKDSLKCRFNVSIMING